MNPAPQVHPIPPLFCAESRVLILGSFPSIASREAKFFFGHPQNRFWRVMAALTGRPVPQTVEDKTALILENGFALWDSVASCTVTGSSDSSIRDVVPNDLRVILETADIQAIFCNGGTSYASYNKYCRAMTGREAAKLPSTSPANARWTQDKLLRAWREALLPYLSEV